MASAAGRVRMRRAGTPGPRGGGIYVSGAQRVRLLDATFAVVAEQGYRWMTVRRVCEQAGISNKTFYDLFSDREDCFLAAFERAVDELAAAVTPVYEGEREWAARIRGSLGALLACLDLEPELRQLVFVEALGAGPRVLRRRAQVLQELGSVVDAGRAGVKTGGELPPLTAEGLVGAAFGVIYGRLIEQPARPLIGLLGPLMATIVLPYRGHSAAAREFDRPQRLPALGEPARVGGGASVKAGGAGAQSIDFRLTVRTQMVLEAIAELGGRGSAPSNRQISDAAEIVDQGQISKLLARLEGHGLIQNSGGATAGVPNAWRLTSRGEELLSASRPTTQGAGR
jgi:AcrR family transcriptional regulator/DNA-binding MarR family transcriptional regulator